MSMACPLFFNMMTQFTSDWFSLKERTGVNALCGLSIPLGNLVAFLLSGLILYGIEKKDLQAQRQLVQRMIWIQNIWISLASIPYFFMLRDKPGADQQQP